MKRGEYCSPAELATDASAIGLALIALVAGLNRLPVGFIFAGTSLALFGLSDLIHQKNNLKIQKK